MSTESNPTPVTQAQHDLYNEILDQVHVRDFHAVDIARGDEIVKAAAWIGDDKLRAVVVFERKYGREDNRGLRTVTLVRNPVDADSPAEKLRIEHDNFARTFQPVRDTRPAVVRAERPAPVAQGMHLDGRQVSQLRNLHTAWRNAETQVDIDQQATLIAELVGSLLP